MTLHGGAKAPNVPKSDTRATQGKLTDNSGGTADETVAAVSGSGADATINNNFADLTAKINNLIDHLNDR